MSCAMYFDLRTAAEMVGSLILCLGVSLVVIGGIWLVARQTGHPLSRPALALVGLTGLVLACLAALYVRC
jgi:hypothetical protein